MIMEIDPNADSVIHNLFGWPEHTKRPGHYRPSQQQLVPSQIVDNTNYNWHSSLCPYVGMKCSGFSEKPAGRFFPKEDPT
jgi:hypothetical protein